MIVPHPWTAILLTLAAFRLTRLLGWDEFPPVARARNYLFYGWKTTQDATKKTLRHKHPLIIALFECPFCLGFWVSIAVYVWWIFTPSWGMYPVVVLAFSGAVGLVAKNWDP